MFSRFVCALLSFCARKFPAKSETREPGKVIVERTSYITLVGWCGVVGVSFFVLHAMVFCVYIATEIFIKI